MLALIILIITYAAQWKYFEKMGHEGWEGIVPFYNYYILFKELYGNGWKMLLMLIPFYGIYIIIKMNIDLARAFNKGTGFGVGLALLPVVFSCILAFGDAVYEDGRYAIVGTNVISQKLDVVAQKADSTSTTAAAGNTRPVRKNPNALETLKELNEMKESGILTEEEFNEKKSELLKQI